jgi:hypothetical protein
MPVCVLRWHPVVLGLLCLRLCLVQLLRQRLVLAVLALKKSELTTPTRAQHVARWINVPEIPTWTLL